MLLEGKVALVTGAARGIGREISLTFAKEGADIIASDINEETLLELAEEIKSLNRSGLALKADVTNLSEIEKGVKVCLDKFNAIDILVNNAGIVKDSLLVRMKESDWKDVLETNLTGTFNWTKAVAISMMKQKKGSIVNIASIIGIIGNPGQANYSASKAGIIGFTKSIARELASRNIRVNAIAPGFIETQMTEKLPEQIRQEMLSRIPLQRLGKPAEVAKAALFLASDLASYITGQVLVVDGGIAM